MTDDRKAYDREYYKRNKEKRRAQHAAWLVEHPEYQDIYQKAYREQNKDKIKVNNARLYNLNAEQRKQYEVIKRATARAACYAELGGYVCKNCGITDKLVLTIDHVNNDGAANRRAVMGKNIAIGASRLLVEIIKNSEAFQVLCFNCNFGKHLNKGVLPFPTWGPK